jgi:hypothetical protein
MMHDAIRQHLTNCGAENLLDLLPALESMEWITHPTAYLQSALVVGCQDDCLILAFARSSRDRPVELCYCSIPKHDNLVRSWVATDLTQDAVEGSQLIPPFKYNAGTSQNGQSMFHTVVQWYFMGLVGGGIKCSIDEYCPKLLDALRHIETRQQLEKSGTLYIATVMENANGETGALTTQERFSAADSRPVAACEDEASDYRTLLEYLEDELLESIPGPDVVEFVIPENPLNNALPRKLLIGSQRDTQNKIFAYMREWGTTHRIEFYVENGTNRTPIFSTDLAQHVIKPPFDKTYPEGSEAIDNSGTARLTTIVKWYFIAAGYAKNCVLKETKDFPTRLRSALLWIRGQVRNSAVGPSAVEDQAGSILLSTVRSELSVDSEVSSTTRLDGTPSPHGSKRTAEDANIRHLTSWIVDRITKEASRDQEDKDQLYKIDQDLRKLQMQRQEIFAKRRKRKADLEAIGMSIGGWTSSGDERADT